jgi:hypothetical protein
LKHNSSGLNQIKPTACYPVHAEIHSSGTVVVLHKLHLGICLVEQLFGFVRNYIGAQKNKEN